MLQSYSYVPEYLIQDIVKLLWGPKFYIPASMCQFKGMIWVQYKLSWVISTCGIILINKKNLT